MRVFESLYYQNPLGRKSTQTTNERLIKEFCLMYKTKRKIVKPFKLYTE